MSYNLKMNRDGLMFTIKGTAIIDTFKLMHEQIFGIADIDFNAACIDSIDNTEPVSNVLIIHILNNEIYYKVYISMDCRNNIHMYYANHKFRIMSTGVEPANHMSYRPFDEKY